VGQQKDLMEPGVPVKIYFSCWKACLVESPDRMLSCIIPGLISIIKLVRLSQLLIMFSRVLDRC